MDAGFLDELTKIRDEFALGPTGLTETADVLKRNPVDNQRGRQGFGADSILYTYPCRMQTVQLTQKVAGTAQVVGMQTFVDLPSDAIITTDQLIKVTHSEPLPAWVRIVRVIGFVDRAILTLRRVIVVDTEIRGST
jgi:hypothetical protein